MAEENKDNQPKKISFKMMFGQTTQKKEESSEVFSGSYGSAEDSDKVEIPNVAED